MCHGEVWVTVMWLGQVCDRLKAAHNRDIQTRAGLETAATKITKHQRDGVVQERRKGGQNQQKCNLVITWRPCLHACFTPLIPQSSLNSLSSWENFTPLVFLVTQHVCLKSASKSFFLVYLGEISGIPSPQMKLHFVPEGPAVQTNLLLLLEFIPPHPVAFTIRGLLQSRSALQIFGNWVTRR